MKINEILIEALKDFDCNTPEYLLFCETFWNVEFDEEGNSLDYECKNQDEVDMFTSLEKLNQGTWYNYLWVSNRNLKKDGTPKKTKKIDCTVYVWGAGFRFIQAVKTRMQSIIMKNLKGDLFPEYGFAQEVEV